MIDSGECLFARADTPQGQASPRAIAAVQPALIKDTRDMIERHHKTLHQAFLAMDKARCHLALA